MTGFETYALLAGIGVGGGLIAGAVGLAGGIFIVPAVMALFGVEAMGDAIVVSFFAVFFNSLMSSVQNRKTRGSEAFWDLAAGAKWYTVGAVLAALVVAVGFGKHKDAISKDTIAVLQLGLAACMLVPRSWYANARFEHGPVKDGAVGSVVGAMSALIGVGGGTYTIAYFMTHGRAIKDCTLTSNFVGVFIGAMSLLGYYGYLLFATVGGAAHPVKTIDTVGKVVLVLAGILACPLGVKLQTKISGPTIKNAIVLFLAASSTYVLFFTH